MSTRVLSLVAAVLALLIIVSRVERSEAPAPDPVAISPVTAPPATPDPPVQRPPRVAPLPGALPDTPTDATPAINRVATLAVRRRIDREGDRVYLDSAWAQTDSTVVRWADLAGLPLRVAFLPDTTLVGWSDALLEAARQGMRAWERNAAGLRLVEIDDPNEAEIEVGFVQTVSGSGEFGVTEFNWSSNGRALHAVIRLALSPDSTVQLVPASQMRRIAAHEFGHAMGLPHSSDRDDLMFPSSPVTDPSRRDQATLQLLYALPPGTIRVQ